MEHESIQHRHAAWRNGTIEVLIEVRTHAYKHEWSAVEAWDKVGEYAFLALRRSDSPRTFVAQLLDYMRITNVYPTLTQAVLDLATSAHEREAEWHEFVDSELQLLLAEGKLRQRERTSARNAEMEQAVGAANELLESVGETRGKKAGKKRAPKREVEVTNG